MAYASGHGTAGFSAYRGYVGHEGPHDQFHIAKAHPVFYGSRAAKICTRPLPSGIFNTYPQVQVRGVSLTPYTELVEHSVVTIVYLWVSIAVTGSIQ